MRIFYEQSLNVVFLDANFYLKGMEQKTKVIQKTKSLLGSLGFFYKGPSLSQ